MMKLLFFWSVLVLNPVHAVEIDPIHKELGDLFEQVMMRKKRPKSPLIQRPVFAKDHSCLKADFIVNPKLEAKYQIRPFDKEKYPAWIRFANDSEYAPDRATTTRGMAIKIIGVGGEKFLDGEKDAITQDFVMQNHPRFFSDNAKDFLEFIKASLSGKFDEYVDAHPETKKVFAEMDENFLSDPLVGRYWTPTPYRLGPYHIKYKTQPCVESDDFLRENLNEHLNTKGDVCMKFWVQFQGDPEEYPLDRATKKWDEKKSPFKDFATILIPKEQDINSEAARHQCESMSFTGWHAAPEMEPLGSLNAARGYVYKRMADARRSRNPNMKIEEPTELQVRK